MSGEALVDVVNRLARKGFDVGGDQLRSRPRGVAADHPRREVLRHRGLTVGREYGEPRWLATPAALSHVRSGWRAMRPLILWLAEHLAAR